ncbi:MAG: translation initiation factor IF-2 [Xanthomonadaceae bacterium]|nr:translation initiation factor IF-2 [Xanthomonadaceae bacterium]
MDSISLLDRLKDLKIAVKNHMSELTDDQVGTARNALKKPEPASKAKKKTATAGTATIVKKKKVVASETEAAPAPQTATAKTESLAGGGLIRRRTRSEDGIVVKSTPPKSTVTETQQAPFSDQEIQTESQTEHTPTQTEEHVETAPQQIAESPEAPIAAVAATVVKKMTSILRTAAPAVHTGLKVIQVAPPTPPPSAVRLPSPRPGGGVSRTYSGGGKPGSGPVGANTPPGFSGTAFKGTTHQQDRDGFRIVKITKENLDEMAKDETSKKKGAKDVFVKPEDVRYGDYRKKEMVFLPKKKRLPIGKEIKRTQITTAAAHKRVVEMGETISVQDFAGQLNVKAGEIIKKLMMMGQMATINQALDFDTATLVANEYQYEVKNITFKEAESLVQEKDADKDLVNRPPVVTIMGHVDHGKTTLLDSLREANVAAGEAGGITQHIGAYTINKDGKLITFIDTPGHEAFSMMRARGANVTDIVILVVSADDGVMPQTREALSHAKAAGVPIIVAVNKIDKPGANPEKIKQALAELDLLAEDWGGQTMFVPVSALKKTNLDKLLESILITAEMADLKANPKIRAEGNVLEAKLDKGRGAVVTLLVKRGTLHQGDIVVSGPFVGRVRAMINYKGETIKEVLPGHAAEILGFEGVPNAGENFNSTEDDATARKIAENRAQITRDKNSARPDKMSLDSLFSKMKAEGDKELKVILKTDVYGSCEAIKESLIKLTTEKVKVSVIHTGTGGITESDVLLASASNAIIIGFNVRPETKARSTAEAEHVEIKTYSIIYEIFEDVKKAMVGLLDKKKVEKYLGRAEVRQTFTVSKVGTIAGSSVIDGKITRGANVRLLRDSKIIFDGKLSSLKRFKDDAKEVAQGYECGMSIENYNDLKVGDIIEAYQVDLIDQELS